MMMKIAIGSVHVGYPLKRHIIDYLSEKDYEYNNFKYYKEVTLKADTSSDAESIYTSVDRYNDNIIAPDSPFTKNGKKFWGWKVNGEVFFEGESIPFN